MSDPVDHPSHYRASSGFEAIDVIEAWGLNFNLGNVIKYTCRAGLKGEERSPTIQSKEKTLEDLRKALWYIEREIRRVERETEVEDEKRDIPSSPLVSLLPEAPQVSEPNTEKTEGSPVALPRDRDKIIERALGTGWVGSPCRLT